MKKIIFVMGVAVLAIACNNETKEPAAAKTETAAGASDVKFPYTVDYSKFEPGNPEYAALILQGSWKDWENGKIDKTKWLADTVMAMHSDNTTTKGADSLVARWNRQRAKYSSSTPQIGAVMSVHSTEQNENWVLVWANEFDVALDGKKDTTAVMEAWRINKDGKADLLLQYDRQKRKQ